MKTVLIALLLAGCSGSGIPLSPEQMAMCESKGCLVMTPEQLKANSLQMAAEHLKPVYEQGVIDGADGCKKVSI